MTSSNMHTVAMWGYGMWPWRTCQRRWTIGRSGERGSGISVLAARHDDEWWCGYTTFFFRLILLLFIILVVLNEIFEFLSNCRLIDTSLIVCVCVCVYVYVCVCVCVCVKRWFQSDRRLKSFLSFYFRTVCKMRLCTNNCKRCATVHLIPATKDP